ncbi:methylamine utilization protein [Colwellia sp. MEBiC06753]
MFYKKTLLWLVLSHVLVLSALASSALIPKVMAAVVINLTDQHGQPLVDAVLEIPEINNQLVPAKTPLVMDQINKTFVPHVLIAPKNSLVTFPNSDDIRHHVYSFSQPKTFELKLYADRPKNPISFEQNGVVVLGCNIHDSMVGYIYVTEHKASFLSDQNGQIIINQLPPAATEFTIWHPLATQGVENRANFPIAKLNAEQSVSIVINTTAPAPRNTFGELSKHAH